MALAWKAGWVNALAGSNPASSAAASACEFAVVTAKPPGNAVQLVPQCVHLAVAETGRGSHRALDASDIIEGLSP